MQEAADRFIMPRFHALQEGDVEEKSPGEVVTRADREAEAFLTPILCALRPEAIVVGEEASATNPMPLDAMRDTAAIWLVDPLDGTSNFIAGTSDFAVMVALLEHGLTTHAWIWRPIDREAPIAVRGSGTTRNGEGVRLGGLRTTGSAGLRGSVRTRFLDDEHRAYVENSLSGLDADVLPGSGCAGVDYPELALGNQDFLLFRRTLPWDHAPGALVIREAGGIVSDGTVPTTSHATARRAFWRRATKRPGRLLNRRYFSQGTESQVRRQSCASPQAFRPVRRAGGPSHARLATAPLRRT